MAERKKGRTGADVSLDYEVLSRIRSAMPDLSPAKQSLARYVMEHVEEAAFISARELGRRAGYSEPVAVRLATNLNFHGYGEFQKALQDVLRQRLWRSMQVNVERNRGADPGSLLAEVYQNELENLARTFRFNDLSSYQRAAGLVMEADWVAVMGSRASQPTASLLHYYLTQIRKAPVMLWQAPDIPQALYGLGPNGLAIVVSQANYDRIVSFVAEDVRRVGGKVIGLVDSWSAPIVALSDLVLVASTTGTALELSPIGFSFIVSALLRAINQKYPDEVEETVAGVIATSRRYLDFEKLHALDVRGTRRGGRRVAAAECGRGGGRGTQE